MERDGADGSMKPERLAGRPWSCGCGVCARPSSAWRAGILTPAWRQSGHCGNKMRVARGSACRWAMLRSWVAFLGLGEGASVVCAAPSVEPVRCFDTAHRLRGHPARTYITDAHHFLNDKGGIAPPRGPAKPMADFDAGVIAYVTDFDDASVTLPRCFKCKRGTVEAALAQDDAIDWHCPRCQAEGPSRTGKARFGTSASGRTQRTEVGRGIGGDRMPQVHR